MNGAKRKFKTFRKQSAYVTQQDHLLKNLTVEEYMTAAAHLKLGNKVSAKEKKSTVSKMFFELLNRKEIIKRGFSLDRLTKF